MERISTVREMQTWSHAKKSQGKRVGFVPTMGYLHEGHLQLVDAAKAKSDVVVLSIFVNPTQFAPGEDLDRYPRDLERDLKLAGDRGVDLCFIPSVEEVYPEGDQTSVVVTDLTRGLCGPFRPGHFRGVTTVVTKLFNMVLPDVAVFGEKDYQQFRVLERLVKDLSFPIEMVGIPTYREADGLAMSSRNVYLKGDERKQAIKIYQALKRAQEALAMGEIRSEALKGLATEVLQTVPNLQMEYLEVVDAKTLEPTEQVTQEARILTAAHLQGTRLIDNLPLIP